MLLAGACSLASAKWSWDTGTKAIEPAGGGGGCLTADGAQPNNELLLRPCNKTDPNQQWAAAQGTVVLAGSPHLGWVSEQNTDAGKRVWLYDLGAGPSHNAYCVAHHNCAFSFDRATGRFTNSAKNCAVMAPAGPPPPPPAPPAPPPGPTMHTCAPGSPVEHERFCDASLSFEERAAALVSNLTLAEKLDLWTVNEMKLNIPRLNIKGFEWDSTCIHGGPFAGATVGPHAINQGATFDTELVEAMSNATADEMRAHNLVSYQQSNGQTMA